MNKKQIIGSVCGLVLVIVGIIFLVQSYQKKDKLRAKITHTFTGSYPDHVRNYMISGIALIVVGGVGILYFIRPSRKVR